MSCTFDQQTGQRKLSPESILMVIGIFFTRDSTAALNAQLDPQYSTHDCDARLATSRLQASVLHTTWK